jgi:2-iminobutanoate/2-iminopropanoate deaminase
VKKEIRTNLAPLPGGHYSQALQVGNRIYVSGQVGIDVKTGEAPLSSEGQTRQALMNIKHILEAAGASMNDAVKVTAYLSNINYFKSFNKAYKEFFTEPYPVRTTVGGSLGGFKVEIDVIAEIE